MSATATGAGVIGGGASVMENTELVNRRVRGFFAPVNRATGMPTIFDPAAMGTVSLDAMPAPWVDLGRCRNFARRSETKVEALRAGAPVMARGQARLEAGATIEFEFTQWSKLALALSAGVQQMNLLAPIAGATARGSGGGSVAAVPLTPGDGGAAPITATTLRVGATAAAMFSVGSLVVVDVDYAGQTGYVGSGASGGYVRSSAAIGGDVDYVRRVSLNVGLVQAVAGGVLTLAEPLLAGVPAAGMQVSRVVGFVDREGDGFLQEWSGLFCVEGEQGDRAFFHYPRLQAMAGAAEVREALSGTLGQFRLKGIFRALATKDIVDGSEVLCYRSYIPAPMSAI